MGCTARVVQQIATLDAVRCWLTLHVEQIRLFAVFDSQTSDFTFGFHFLALAALQAEFAPTLFLIAVKHNTHAAAGAVRCSSQEALQQSRCDESIDLLFLIAVKHCRLVGQHVNCIESEEG